MELQGKAIVKMPEKSEMSARGEWKVKEYVTETYDWYPHKMVFSVSGEDRLQRLNTQTGQEASMSLDIDTHEYNGRWFNSIRVFDIHQVDPVTYGVQGAPAPPVISDSTTTQQANPQQGGAQAPFPP